MKQTVKAALVLAALAVAGCTSPDRFDNSDQNAGLDAGGVIPGTVDDPSSAAYFQQRIGDRVLFPVDQSDLTQEARAVLEGQAQWLLLNADYMGIIEGHADEQGTREYNLALGARRANAVMEYLVSRGVPANRLKFVSYGKERPIEICSQESCYAQNRRAVTIISGGPVG